MMIWFGLLITCVVLAADMNITQKYQLYYGNTCIVQQRHGQCFAFTKNNYFTEVNPKDIDVESKFLVPSFGILGVVSVTPQSQRFIVSVEARSSVGSLLNQPVYKVDKVSFVPLMGHIDDSQETVILVQTLLRRIQRVLLDGFYYAEDYDLSISLQSQYDSRQSTKVSESPSALTTTSTTTNTITVSHTTSTFSLNDYFLTSKYMRNELLALGLPDHMIIRSIRGHFEKQTVIIGETVLHIATLSCTSPHRIGTRYNVRGADVAGNVANCVRTEVTLWLDNDPSTFVTFAQLRGSIPIVWCEPGGRLHVNNIKEHHETAVSMHVRLLEGLFGEGPIIFVSLLEKAGREKTLGEEFERVVMTTQEKVKFIRFPFHTKSKDTAWNDKLVSLMNGASANKIGFLSVDSGIVQRKQKGVIRTNCLDCMDRTSLVQNAISESMLFSMLCQLLKSQLFGVTTDHLNTVKKAMLKMSVNTAHTISRHYSGSSALRTDLCVYGYTTYFGILNDFAKSAYRSINQMFWDEKKQGAMNAVCGFDARRLYPVDGWAVDASLAGSEGFGDANILGVVKGDSASLLVSITQSELINELPTGSIYKIGSVSVDVVDVGSGNLVADLKVAEAVKVYLEECHLYYSPLSDISSNQVFCFNQHMQSLAQEETVSVFMGSVKVFSVGGLSVILIKRESVLVKTMVELELILKVDGTVRSVKSLVSKNCNINSLYKGKNIITIKTGEEYTLSFDSPDLWNGNIVFNVDNIKPARTIMTRMTRKLLQSLNLEPLDHQVIPWLLGEIPSKLLNEERVVEQANTFSDMMMNMISPWQADAEVIGKKEMLAIVHGIKSPHGSPKKKAQQ